MTIRKRQNSPPGGPAPVKVVVQPQGSRGEPRVVAAQAGSPCVVKVDNLLEEALSRKNMLDALKRVKENKGAPGVDGMTVEQLPDYLRQSWPLIRDQLLQNTYRPLPVRRVEIPKPAGGTRTLGIPSVLDRLIQQAIAQVLTPVFDPLFSPCSFGFRPGRRGHDAVRQAVQYVNEGSNWVVDLDLEKFFDRVNHDKLMARIARRVADKRLLTLIRRYLNSGVLLNGVVICSEEGTPQGGPLSPLLSNVMLDDLDRELERRGLRFVRYADDANIYVRSQRAGLRVKASITQFLTDRLSLKVNEAKSAVDRPWRRKFLGFSMYHQRKTVRPRLSPQALRRVRERIRALTSRSRSQPMARRIETLNQFLRGWLGYYALADARHSLMALDGWIRRRLRMCLWKQWKRAITRYRNLRQHGLSEHLAWEGAGSKRSSWRLSKSPPLHAALGTPYWVRQGLFSLEHGYQKLRQA